MKELKTIEGQVFFVDDEDVNRVNGHKWRLSNSFRRCARRIPIHIYTRIKSHPILLQNFILELEVTTSKREKGSRVTLLDASNFNYCRNNILITSRMRVAALAPPHVDSSSMFKGVSYCIKNSYWFASSKLAGASWTRSFHSEFDAVRAYDTFCLQQVGLPCFLNFIDGKLNPWFSSEYRKLSVELLPYNKYACPMERSLSGYRGVNTCRQSSTYTTYQARIIVNPKQITELGCFDTAEKAAIAFDIACWKEFHHPALLNFPERIPEYEKENTSVVVH